MKSHVVSITVGLVFAAFLLVPSPTYATSATFFGPIVPAACHCDNQPNPAGGTITTAPDFGCVMDTVHNAINFGITLATILFTIYLVITGFSFMTSGGSPQSVSSAKTRFMNVFVGLAVLLCAWLIVDFVMKTVYDQGKFGPWNAILAGQSEASRCILAHTPSAITNGQIVAGGLPGTSSCGSSSAGPITSSNCLILGDSLTDGVGPSFPNCTQSHHGGYTVAQIKGIVPQGQQFGWVFVSAGANSSNDSNLAAQLEQLHGMIHAQRIIWILPNNNAAGAVQQVASAHGESALSYRSTDYLARIGDLHMTTAGYARFATEKIAPLVGTGSANSTPTPCTNATTIAPAVEGGATVGGGACGELSASQMRPVDAAGHMMAASVAPMMINLIATAQRAGIHLVINEAYRSDATSLQYWNAHHCSQNPGACSGHYAKPCQLGGPGSNHLRGTAVDFSSCGASLSWLRANAPGLGFSNQLHTSDVCHYSTNGH